jgi:hypothetical protein
LGRGHAVGRVVSCGVDAVGAAVRDDGDGKVEPERGEGAEDGGREGVSCC